MPSPPLQLVVSPSSSHAGVARTRSSTQPDYAPSSQYRSVQNVSVSVAWPCSPDAGVAGAQLHTALLRWRVTRIAHVSQRDGALAAVRIPHQPVTIYMSRFVTIGTSNLVKLLKRKLHSLGTVWNKQQQQQQAAPWLRPKLLAGRIALCDDPGLMCPPGRSTAGWRAGRNRKKGRRT